MAGEKGAHQDRLPHAADGTPLRQRQGHAQRYAAVPGGAELQAGGPGDQAPRRGRRGQAGHGPHQGPRARRGAGRQYPHRPPERGRRLRHRALHRREEDPVHLPDRLRRRHHPAEAESVHRPDGVVQLAAVPPVREVGVRQPEVQEDRHDRLRLRLRLGGGGGLPAHLRRVRRADRPEALAPARERRLRPLSGPAQAGCGCHLLRLLRGRRSPLRQAVQRGRSQGAPSPGERRHRDG